MSNLQDTLTGPWDLELYKNGQLMSQFLQPMIVLGTLNKVVSHTFVSASAQTDTG